MAIAFFLATVMIGRAITRREIENIPLQQRQQMTDLDWIGVEQAMPYTAPLAIVSALFCGAALSQPLGIILPLLGARNLTPSRRAEAAELGTLGD